MNKRPSKPKQLEALLQGKKTMLVLIQDNPDPDAIASAVALKTFANSKAQVQCSITHGGTVGRAENQTMVSYLGLNLRPRSEVDLSRFDLIALVDTQPGTGNNALDKSVIPHIVIDHHPVKRLTRSCLFTDIRRRYGATSTILYEYLCESSVEVDIPLATALLYGIRSDTQNLGRETSQADIDAFLALYPKANKRYLSKIEHGKVPTTYYRLLNRAIGNAMVFGSCIITNLEETDNPDMISEIADLFMRHETCTWSMCYGLHNDRVLFSLRTSDSSSDAGKIARKMAGKAGAGGGHDTLAAGLVPIKTDMVSERAHVAGKLIRIFLKSVGASGEIGHRLIPG